MDGKIVYQFTNSIWQYSTPKGGWYFVSLPLELSKEIRDNLKWQEEGWGRLQVTAQVNKSEWRTAVWFDTKLSTYILPVKADIRRKESLKIGDDVFVTLWL